MSRSRSPRRKSNLELHEHIIGDYPGRVYIDIEVTADAKNEQIAKAIALYDRAARHLTLADVKVDAPWRGKGICSKIVERLFKLAGEKYQPRSFAIDVRPQRGSDTGPRACACYMNALRRAWDGHISRMRIEFESGETLSDAQAEAAACREGNLFMEGDLTWR